jgi:EmrB/QacA subfamily drug resistance transporter
VATETQQHVNRHPAEGLGPAIRAEALEARHTRATWATLGHPRRRAILGVLCLSLLVVVIDNTVLNTALPVLAEQLHAGTAALQWITDAYTLCFAALLIPAGALGDRFGRRKALLGGLAVFGLGSLAAAFSPSAGALIGARVVMGVGAAFVMPATLSILNAVFPAAERPRAIGAWAAVAGVGIVVGPTLGGALLSNFAWGSIFLDNVPLVLLAGSLVGRLVPETAEPGPGRLDWTGVGMVAAGLVAVVDAIIEAPGRGWTAPATLAEAALGVGVLALFVRRQLRLEHPLLDLRIFSHRAFSAAAGSVTLLFFALFGSLFALTQYLQLVAGYSPFGAGVRALPFALAMGLVSPLSTVAAGRLGTRAVIGGGLALMGGGLLGLSFAGVATPYLDLAGWVTVMGAGMGLVMAPASTTIMATVPAHQAGAGSAVNDTIREVGGALGVAVIGSLVASRYTHQLSGVLRAHHAPAVVTRVASGSVAAADAVGRHVGGALGLRLTGAAHVAYTSGMATGMRVAAAVALAGAVGLSLLLPRRSQGGLATLTLAAPGPAAVPEPACAPAA